MSFGKTVGLAMILALPHAGCGGDGGAKPSNVDPPFAGTNLGPQEWAAVGHIGVGSQRVPFEVSVDWTFRSNNVDVYVTTDDCVDTPTALSAWSCIIVVKAEGQTAKPERATFLGEADSSYKVFVVNRGTRPDVVTVNITNR